MTGQPTLIIEDSSGSTKAVLEADTAQATTEYRKMDRAQAVVDSDEFDAVSLRSRSDRLRIERPDGSTLFGGRYDDDAREGDTTVVKIASYQRDAVDAEPTPPNLTLQNTPDSTVIQTRLVDAVPTLSAGNIATLAPALSYSFPNSSRAQVGKTVSVATGGELRYNADRTVDYQGRLGRDLGITVSADNRNVVGEPRVRQDVRDDVTHIRGFGAGDGPNQVQAEAVASSYSGGRQVWREFEDTDIKDQSRLQTVIDRLVDELDGEPRQTTVEATLVDVDVQLGDRLQVTLPDRGINRQLRIKRLVERFGVEGHDYVATLVNRQADEDLTGDEREDVQRFNRGYQGFVDRVQAGGDARQPVSPTLSAQSTRVYPDDVVREDVSRVLVEGLPYRAYSGGAANNPAFTVGDRTDVDGGFVTIDGSDTWFTLADINPSPAGPSQMVHIYVVVQQLSASFPGPRGISLRLAFDAGSDGYWPAPSGRPLQTMPVGTAIDSDETITTFSPSLAGDFGELGQLELQAKLNFTASSSLELSSQLRLEFDDVHTHPPSPGVVEDFDGETFYPSNCDVLVNGNPQGVSLGDGSGTFREFVDIGGELTPGINDIEVSSDTRGHIRTTLETELFRRGPT